MPRIYREKVLGRIIPTCFYCGGDFTPEDGETLIRFDAANAPIRLHEGECWDLFVVGILKFNTDLMDDASKKKYTVVQ